MDHKNVDEFVKEVIEEYIDFQFESLKGENNQIPKSLIVNELKTLCPSDLENDIWEIGYQIDSKNININHLKIFKDMFYKIYLNHKLELGVENAQPYIQSILIAVLDESWREHLSYISEVKESIHLRAFGQKDPLQEYNLETYKAYENMMNNFYTTILRMIMHLKKVKS
jgi:preprotein translocase subunit SecA